MEDGQHMEEIGDSKFRSKDVGVCHNQIIDKVSPLICNKSNDLSPYIYRIYRSLFCMKNSKTWKLDSTCQQTNVLHT
jgi:hypothetical protein